MIQNVTGARVAYDPEWAEYNGSAHKLLSDNRDAYIAQSAATRDGSVAPWQRLQADFEREFGSMNTGGRRE